MSNAPPLARRSLVDDVVQRIGRNVVAGEYAPGAALPNEAEWEARLGVSRSVLREALRVLVSKNLIDIRSRTGGRVRDRAAWNMLDPDILEWRAEGGDTPEFIAELYEVRRMFEPAAAALAATRISAEELEALRAAHAEMQAAGEDVDRFLAPDQRFHAIIASAVGNSLFRALGGTVSMALDITLRMALAAPRGQQQSVPLHGRVLDALATRDPEAASAAMLHLIDEAQRDVAEVLAANGRSPRGKPSRRRE